MHLHNGLLAILLGVLALTYQIPSLYEEAGKLHGFVVHD